MPIEEHMPTDKKTHQQLEFLNKIIETLLHPFYVIDVSNYTILKTNSATGSKTTTCYELIHDRTEPCSGRDRPCPLDRVKKTKKPVAMEHRYYDTQGNIKIVDIAAHPIFDNRGNVTQVIECILDITERKRAEERLQEAEEQYRLTLDSIGDAIHVIDSYWRFIIFNTAFRQWNEQLGLETDVIGRTLFEVFPFLPNTVRDEYLQVFDTGEKLLTEERTRVGDKEFITETRKIPIYEGEKVTRIATVIRDITERKRSEELMSIQHDLAVALSAENELSEGLRLCFEAASRASGMDCGGIYLVDEISGALNLVFHKGLTPDFVRCVSRYDADSANTQLVMAGKPIYTSHLDLEVPLDEPQRREGLLAIAVIPIPFEHQVIGCINISSHTCIIIPSSIRSALKTIAAQIGSAIARLKSKKAFRMSRARFRDLVDLLPQAVFEIDNEGNFSFLNTAGLKSFGYAQEDIDKGLSALQLAIPKDRKRAAENLRKVLNGGKSIGNEYTVMRKDGSTFPVILYASPIIHEDGPAGLRGIVIDITERKQFVEERLNNLERLRRSLEKTIAALVSTLEAKDPYTAGHQKRVADLAVAIAEEMGLSDEQIDGIRMAGLVHDIGKIYIPSDLLNRAKRLSETEYELFKSHCQVGYEILKSIDFPWPIAPMVLQHHERLDGSGYPQGLDGSDIMLEARILAVADVIEAMSAHRPYRPAYSVGDALEEVLHHKDDLYDPDVVDACLRVFYDKGFSFEKVEQTEM
jgi:PAS domain S-box-containing protein/putative nucleotidyltransferase with HDIG domain